MIEAFFIIMMLMVGVTLGEGDSHNSVVPTHPSDAAVDDDSPAGHAVPHPCAARSPQWRDLSEHGFGANLDGSYGQGTTDEI